MGCASHKEVAVPMNSFRRLWSIEGTRALLPCLIVAVAILTPTSAGAAASAPRFGGAASSVYGPLRTPLYSPRGAGVPFSGSEHGVCTQANPEAGQCLIDVLLPSAD